MHLEEQIDPDEILRDIGDNANETDMPDNLRELDFRSLHDHNANYMDIAGDLDNL
jgi:hypothetical protein